MEITGKVAVVTGAASGIGKALAARLIADGAKGVVLTDLDEAGVQAAADELGAAAIGLYADASSEADIAAAIAAAERDFGPVSLFFANAGIAVQESEQADDDTWDLNWRVNTYAHVIAARLLVPGWLERGEGHFVSTASAAGLLTQVGSAPYAVTKHAAVGFAEWLAVTYGDRGIGVTCLCPMGVDTPLLRDAGGSNEQDGESTITKVVTSAGAVLSPEQVASETLDAVRANRFIVLPHPEVLDFASQKTSDYDRWISGVQRMRRKVAGE